MVVGSPSGDARLKGGACSPSFEGMNAALLRSGEHATDTERAEGANSYAK